MKDIRSTINAIDAVNATRGKSPGELIAKFTPEQMASALHLLHHWHKGDSECRDKRSGSHYQLLQHFQGKYNTVKHENNQLRKKLQPKKYPETPSKP